MKYLRAFLIVMALTLASGVIWAQKPTEPKALAEGFFSRSLIFDDGGEVIQIAFPPKYRTYPDNVVIFDEGAEHALKNYFGCAKFKDCKPKLIFDQGVTADVGLDTYALSLLRNADADVIGINMVKIPKVIL